MKVEFVGFKIHVTGPVTLQTLMEVLEQRSSNVHTGGPAQKQYVISTSADSDYFIGLVITMKNHKNFLEWKEGKIVVHTISELGKFMEFNYFVINKKTGAGLYQKYHNSSALSTLCDRLKKYHAQLHKQFLEGEFKKIENITPKEQKKIRKMHKGQFKWLPLFSSSDKIEKLLNQLDRISHVTIDAEYAETKESLFKPSASPVRNVRQIFTLGRGVKPHSIVDSIYNVASKIGVDKVSVAGYENNVRSIIRLADHVEVYRQYEFDEVVQTLKDIDPIEQLATSWVVQQLLKACKETPNIHY